MLSEHYPKRLASLVLHLARTEPQWIKEAIVLLRQSGDLEPDDLAHLDRIAERWIRQQMQRREGREH